MVVVTHFARRRGRAVNGHAHREKDLIRVFDADPDLLAGVSEPAAGHLRTRMAVRSVWVERGAWNPATEADQHTEDLGLLVVDGLLVRTLRLAGRECSEVVGPGDLIRPWDADDGTGSVASASDWHVLRPARLASLDGRFAACVARWPAITAALLARSTRRSRALVFQATIAHVRRAETRLLLALWQLADRWGRVTPRGVVMPVPLTHQLLAQLTCLRRPTVSAGLGQLAKAGEISTVRGGGWLLHGDPPCVSGDEDEDGWADHGAQAPPPRLNVAPRDLDAAAVAA